MFLCNIVLYSIGLSPPDTSTTWYAFHFGPPLHSFCSYFSVFPSGILDSYRPGGSSLSIISFCIFTLSYCSWGSRGKNTEVVCHSLFQWTTFCQTSPPWPKSDRQSAWWTMNGGSWHCTGNRNQDHPREKEMQKNQMAVWGGLTNSCENKGREKAKEKRKDILIWMQSSKE